MDDTRRSLANSLGILPSLTCVTSLDGVLLEMNPVWTKVLGYSLEEMLNRPYFDFVHPDDIEKTQQETLSLSTPSYLTFHFENRYRHKDGHYVWLAWGARNVNGFIIGMAMDITPTKENETFLDDVQHQAQIGGWCLDVETGATRWTSETFLIHGLASSSGIATAPRGSVYHWDDHDRYLECLEQCRQSRRPFSEDLRLLPAEGGERWVHVTGYPVLEMNDRIVRIQGTIQDISRRKALEHDRAERQAQLEHIIQNAPGMVYQFATWPNGAQAFLFASSKGFAIYEITEAEYRENNTIMLDMVHPEDKPGLYETFNRSATSLSHFTWSGRIVTKTGKIKWLSANSIPSRQPDGVVVWDGVIVDITTERTLAEAFEQQRRVAEHSARLASIGELAAGVGHEINNPLAIAVATIEVLKEDAAKAADPAAWRSLLETQANALERIQKIVGGLRSLARVSDDSGCGSVNVALRNTIGLVAKIYSHDGIAIEFDEPPIEVFAACDVNRMQQVVMNLLSNARDAIGKNVAGVIRVWMEASSDFVTFYVRDNGVGMSEGVKQKIFDSFFTTKSVGQGLGLAICMGIVQSCGGSISAEGELGLGSTFQVSLPRVQPQITEVKPDLDRCPPTPKVALVVEDEPDLRVLLSVLIARLGYEVLTASNGHDGLAIMRDRVTDLVISDLQMPGMDGLTFLKEARMVRPDHPVISILATGGHLSQEQVSALRACADSCLTKPFSMEQLRECVSAAELARTESAARA